MLFVLAGAAIGAGLNYLGAQDEQGNIDKQKSALEDTMITSSERNRMMRDLDRGFNADISTQMNSMALTTRGTDASMATAAALGQAEGSRIRAKSDMFSKITGINKDIQARIAGISDVNTTSAIVGGAFEGAQMGSQVGELAGASSFFGMSIDNIDTNELTSTAGRLGDTPDMEHFVTGGAGQPLPATDSLLGRNTAFDPHTGRYSEPRNKVGPDDINIQTPTKTKSAAATNIVRPDDTTPSRGRLNVPDPSLSSTLNLGNEEVDPTNQKELYLAGRATEAGLEDAPAPWEIYGGIRAVSSIGTKSINSALNVGGKNIGRGIGRIANPGSVMDDVAGGVRKGLDDFADDFGGAAPIMQTSRRAVQSRTGGIPSTIQRPGKFIDQPSATGATMPWNPVKRYETPTDLISSKWYPKPKGRPWEAPDYLQRYKSNLTKGQLRGLGN